MKRTSILIVFCLAFAAQAFCQDSVTLQYKYTAGELLRYKMVMDASMQLDTPNGSLTIPVRMAAVMKQRTKRVLKDGNAELVVAFESMRMQLGTEVREMPVKELPVMTVTVSKHGQVCSANVPGMAANPFMNSQMMNSGGFGNYVVFPEGPIKVGDAWELNLPQVQGLEGIRAGGELLSTNTKLGKYTVSKIRQTIGGNLNLDMPTGLGMQTNSAMPGMKMDGAFLGDGTVFFSAERGQMIRADGRVDLQVNVNIPEINGQQIGNARAVMQMGYEIFLISAGK